MPVAHVTEARGTNVVDEHDLAAYLSTKGVKTFRSSGSELQTFCFECEIDAHKGRGRLYLNAETWQFICFKCDFRGGRKTLIEFFGDSDGLTFDPGKDPLVRQKILTEAADLAHEMLLANTQMCEYLLGRGLTSEIILEAKLGFVPMNFGLSGSLPSREKWTYKDLISAGLVGASGKEFFNNSLVIPYWSRGHVVQLREKVLGGKYRTAANDHSRIFNQDALTNPVDVLVVEGEYDCLAVRGIVQGCSDRVLNNLAVVGIAGAGSWPEGLVESLSHANRVFIGFDADDTGRQFAKKLKTELGPKARMVNLPDGTDWSDLLSAKTNQNPNGGRSWTDVRDLLTEADMAGKRLFSVQEASLKWTKVQNESPGLKLGWPQMDAIIRPGLKPGHVMIPLAGTSAGKSVTLSNIAHNLRNEGVLYMSLELTASEVFEHLRRIHKFWFPKANKDEMLEDYGGLRIVELNRIRPGDLQDMIAEYEVLEGRRPALVIVDYLQYFARGFRGSSAYDRATDAVMELKAVAKEESVVIISPSQVNRNSETGKPLSLDAARDAGTIEETGDFVCALFRPEMSELGANKADPNNPPPPRGSLNIQLLKSRAGGADRVFNLKFSPLSLVIVDPMADRKAALRVEQEVAAAAKGLHYIDYRKQLDAESAQDALPLDGVPR